MGRISTPILNKVGYSMFWNSMWDNKINYTRSLKEDIYLNRFVNLVFEDNISANTLKFFNKKYLNLNYSLYKIPSKVKTEKNLKNYFIKFGKVEFYTSRLWILKYQKWVILYLYIYLPLHNKLKIRKNLLFKDLDYNDDIFNLYNFYKKSNLKISLSFKLFQKQQINYYF